MDKDDRETSLKDSIRSKHKQTQSRSRSYFVPGYSSHNNRSKISFITTSSGPEDELAPVMPAIDACQLIDDEAKKSRDAVTNSEKYRVKKEISELRSTSSSSSFYEGNKNQNRDHSNESNVRALVVSQGTSLQSIHNQTTTPETVRSIERISIEDQSRIVVNDPNCQPSSSSKFDESNDVGHASCSNSSNLVDSLPKPNPSLYGQSDEYEFIPKSSILDVYSNDPEVKRFLKQLTKIANEYGYDDQDYKCQSCRRPIGLVFGQSRLCHFDGHHYCSECHLNEKSVIPARILCNWDFNKYTISKRNQHFLNLISNEPMFELKSIGPLLYESCPELIELDEMRRQAFFIRSYCFTCAQESVSFELTKQVWPREHLIKQIDLYSLDDLVQAKNGSLKNVLKNVISFGRDHVSSCMLCCFKGFFCELCKSSQIIYPFDTDTVRRCDFCQSIYHKMCFDQQPNDDPCPRCRRVRARQSKE